MMRQIEVEHQRPRDSMLADRKSEIDMIVDWLRTTGRRLVRWRIWLVVVDESASMISIGQAVWKGK